MRINKISSYIFLYSIVLSILPGSVFSQSWVLQNSGTTKKLNSISVTRNLAWVCGDSGTVLKTTNNGTNWISFSGNGIPANLKLINIFCHKTYSGYFNDLRYAFTTGFDNSGAYIYMTSNGGNNWTLVHTAAGNGAKLDGIWFKDTINGYAQGEPFGGRWQLWKTTNRGLNWDSAGLYLNGTNYSSFSNSLCGKMNIFDSVLFFGANYNNSESRVFRSTNFGRNWDLLTTGINHTMTSLFYLRSSSQKVYLGGNKYYSISSNAGNNWTTFDSNSIASSLVCAVTDNYSSPAILLKTDTLGWQSIYISWSNNWYSISASGLRGLNNMNGFDYTVYAVGDSGKIYFKGILYPLVKKEGIELPDNYKLYQNYPNPFNPTSLIRFNVKEKSPVSLKIFNSLGAEISVLVNEALSPGEYEATFDGTLLPSGVYFYRLTAGDYSETKKMVLIK